MHQSDWLHLGRDMHLSLIVSQSQAGCPETKQKANKHWVLTGFEKPNYGDSEGSVCESGGAAFVMITTTLNFWHAHRMVGVNRKKKKVLSDDEEDEKNNTSEKKSLSTKVRIS